ncbi:hypothetical protein [Halorhodospira halochloris]|uniref:hypothetical protein n=1 Tax=Halorhodospira halochloris TaxID=1052 RepID=UPI00076F70D0|nr:hypothetical protein [Halorhodospira halochloris]
MNPSLEASWRHPWRQDLHTGADDGSGEVRGAHKESVVKRDKLPGLFEGICHADVEGVFD